MRRLLTWLALIAFTTGSGAALVRVIRAERNATPPFRRDDLGAWLTQPHQAGESGNSPAVRRRAARQLDQDFHAAFDWQPTYAALPADRQATFLANFRALLAMLVEQRADAYFALPKQHREGFLDAEVNDFATWYVVGKSGRSSGVALFQQGMTAMSSGELSGAAGKKERDFVSAFQSHVMRRALGRMSPFGGGPSKRDD